MKTEEEKMLAGELYDASDRHLTQKRNFARQLLNKLNNNLCTEGEDYIELLKKILPNSGSNLFIQPPFYCDYGSNIFIGDDVYFNFNCVVLDVTPVKIGDRSMFGPNVQIYAATHPVSYNQRASGLEFGKPIVIGEDVWVGGNAVICPGVTIGDRSVIGAGSVVTKDILADVVAVGNPCRILNKLS